MNNRTRRALARVERARQANTMIDAEPPAFNIEADDVINVPPFDPVPFVAPELCACGEKATRPDPHMPDGEDVPLEFCDECRALEEQHLRDAEQAGHDCRVCLPGPCVPEAHGFPGGYDEDGGDVYDLAEDAREEYQDDPEQD